MKKFLISYFIFVFFFLTLFSSGFVDSQDGFQYLAIARRIYYDHTFEMPQEEYPDNNIHLSLIRGKDGKIYSPTGLGYSLALLPAVFGEDIFLRLSHQTPISAFPLQNDWPVLLFASFTNSIFGALLAITLFSYLRIFNIKKEYCLLISFTGIFSTNLFSYSKDTFAQIMFTSFSFLTFFLIKKYSILKNPIYLTFSGIVFGVVVISYNPTYTLLIIPLIIYYFLLNKPKRKLSTLKISLRDIFFGLLGLFPFLILYYWFDSIRINDILSGGYSAGTTSFIPPAYVFIEGIWGLLFSPGKSFFLFSPVLLTIFIFWYKFKKEYFPEIITFGLISIIFLIFMGTLQGDVDFLVWHGDSSWGPRYLVPVIPFLLILFGLLFSHLKRINKLIIVYPLIIIGIFIQLPAILLPYQIRFAGLQTDAFINGRNFNVYEYGNEIPRYSPVFTMAKTLIKRVKNVKRLYDHGTYNVSFYDGFDYPFDLGWTKWRGTLPIANIAFDDNENTQIKNIELQFRNHQIDNASSYSAQLKFTINNISNQSATIPVNKEDNIKLDLSDNLLVPARNTISIQSTWVGTSSAILRKQQVLFLEIMRINGQPVNLETIDYPYVSSISAQLSNINYSYWGGAQKDPWSIWNMHSGVYEQTFDLWWLRPLHYWDLPKTFFIMLFIVNISGIIFFGVQSYRNIKSH